jgi:single-strand DNA-binding protein
MPGTVNKAFLIGRLGRDPEIRVVGDNHRVCNFTLATDERWKDASGAVKERTDWHRITVWGRQAENVHRYLRKGSLAWIEGNIRYRESTDREGQRRWFTDIVAMRVSFLDKKDSASGEHSPALPSHDRAPADVDLPVAGPEGYSSEPPAAGPPDTPISPLAHAKLPGEDDVPF